MLTERFQPVIDNLRPALGVLLANLFILVLDNISAQVGDKT